MNANERAASKTRLSPEMVSLLLVLAAIAAVELLSRTVFKIRDPSPILLSVVILAALSGGLRVGLLCAIVTSAYLLYYWQEPSIPQQFFHYSEDDLARLSVWFIVAPVMVLSVSHLKRRSELRRQQVDLKIQTEYLEPHKSELTMQLVPAKQELGIQLVELKRVQSDLQESELRFRRLFEAAQDGILLLDADTGQITEVNPFLEEILGYSRDEFLGKKLWEIGAFNDSQASRNAFRELRERGYIRYENLPLKAKGRGLINVEFVSNVYQVDGKRVIQCNIRDITDRKQAEEALQEAHAKLTAWVSELEQRNRGMSLLNEMGDLLHSCVTSEEAYTVIAQFAPQLFPAESGALGVLNASRSMIELMVTWGELPGRANERTFPPDDCWALRRGRLHYNPDTRSGLVCKHLGLPLPSAYLCAPLLAEGEIFGLLHLSKSSTIPTQLTESKRQLAVSVAEQIELALANLKLRETLRSQSIRDPLTGLFNRRYMEESLAREISRAKRDQYPFGVIMLDLDHFKDFNDANGHEAGDVLLRELGPFLQNHLRGGDIACRYGGEEFTLILPEISLEITRQRAEEMREGFKQLQLEYRGRSLGRLTLSLGVAIFPNHGSTTTALLRAADAALYLAKGAGRDRVIVAE